ncbi:MAG: CvpA family protein [Flavobacteriales bacterium]|nr:CvpA family protein [Flavobacteriales bacterium]
MNWLDWVLVALLVFAAFKGFSRGFIVEVGSLVALVGGVWAGIHLSERVVDAIGLDTKSAAVAFLVTFLLVLVGVHLLAKGLTTLIDMAQLSLPNKWAGVAFGLLRSAFTISIALNLMAGSRDGSLPSDRVREGSSLYAPIQSFAPFVVPVLGETKWLAHAMGKLQEEIRTIEL